MFFGSEYKHDHSEALKSALNTDQNLKEISQDVISIIEEYIISMVIAEKKQKKTSYKRIHSTIIYFVIISMTNMIQELKIHTVK